MALFTGTAGDDTLRATIGDDTLVANGGRDILAGKGGADTYDLHVGPFTVGAEPFYSINETRGGDASVDSITGIAALSLFVNATTVSYAHFWRGGADGQHLMIETATKPHSRFSTGVEPGTIRIINQHSADFPDAQIERLVSNGVEYNLLTGDTGTDFNDIMTGWKLADTFHAGAGDDYISGGNGRDSLNGEDGQDTLFGEGGGDYIYGGAGADRIFGGAGVDRIYGGDDADVIEGGHARDILRGQNGNDLLEGGAGNDWINGGRDSDTLIGGAGDDRMIGGNSGDTYVISSLGDGIDTIVENGTPAQINFGWNASNLDEIEFTGFTTLDEARHSVDISIVGDDLIFNYTNPSAPGTSGQVTVENQFLSDRTTIDQVDFGTGGVDAIYHLSVLSGDDFTFSIHGGSDAGGNDIVFGTAGDDEIYGGLGSDIMIGGGGADHFMFHDEEDARGGTDLILDFDVANDVLDFTDIKGFVYGGLTITDSAHGNALISSIYGAIELDGITAAEVTEDIFALA